MVYIKNTSMLHTVATDRRAWPAPYPGESLNHCIYVHYWTLIFYFYYLVIAFIDAALKSFYTCPPICSGASTFDVFNLS